MSTQTKQVGSTLALRWTLILTFAALAFFASYRFAVARTSTATTPAGVPVAAAGAPAGTSGSAAGGCGGGCCGGGATGPKTTKKAVASGAVQKISVDLSKGYYDPSTIELKAGVPAEITFGQSSGCTGQVQSPELNFFEDLTAGPKTIKLGALKAGTYTFTCGMQMVSGTIVVK